MDFTSQQQILQAIVDKLDKPGAAELVQVMLAFYRDHRVDGVEIDGDGDMLLFQWGTYDWGEGKKFELDITRQFIDEDEECSEMIQLHMTLKFAVTDELEQIESGNEWCDSPEDINDFVKFVESNKAYQLLGKQRPSEIEVFLEEV